MKRSNLSRNIIEEIERDNLPNNSIIIFSDTPLYSSEEAYFALGTGKALDFWFNENNYFSCFEAFEVCEK